MIQNRKELPVCGFTNESNFCFLLANLQVILHSMPDIRDFIYFVSKIITEHHGAEPNPQFKISEKSYMFLSHMAQLLHAIRKNEKDGFVTYNISSFIKFFYNYMEDFEYGRQQDAHECMSVLLNEFLDNLTFEMQRKFEFNTNILLPDLPVLPQDHIAANTTNYINKSFARKLLGGMKENKLVCQECGFVSRSVEQFTELILNIPQQQTVSLEDCIKLGFVTEQLTGEEMWFCPTCKKRVVAEKSEKIIHTPPILVCVLKRFQTNDFQQVRRRNKDDTKVSVPINLDMSLDTGTKINYECVGIVSHLGTNIDFGHYVAYAKCNSDWYLFNDDKCVKFKIECERIATTDAYILVYKKK
jgi:ubiquitin C-terminal hydrolase